MKKLSILFLIQFFMLLFASITVFAADNSISFSTDATKVNKGDTFIATFEVTSNPSLNGIQFSLNFDDTRFEFQKAELQNPAEYAFFNSEPDNIAILSINGSDTPLAVDITFKVKEDAPNGKYQISTSDIQVSYMEVAEIEKVEPQVLTIKVGNLLINSPILWILIVISAILVVVLVLFLLKKKKSN